MVKKIRDFLYELCNYLELIMAVVVVAGIVIAALGLREEFLLFWSQRGHTGSFYVFLDAIFEIVISIEFLKMLCQPSADTVLEVLIFLVSRHMIIGDTSAFEDFVSIVSIALLLQLKNTFRFRRRQEKERVFFLHAGMRWGMKNPMEKNREKYMRAAIPGSQEGVCLRRGSDWLRDCVSGQNHSERL